MEKMYEERNPGVVGMLKGDDPLLENLYSEPRFQALRKKIELLEDSTK